MHPGVIQLPPSGEPIILLNDCQTTGGYPIIGSVIAADLRHLSQLGAGDCIHLSLQTDINQAQHAQSQTQAHLNQLQLAIAAGKEQHHDEPTTPLIGILVIIVGFAMRFNPLLVVSAAGLITGWAVGIDFISLIATFGEKFMNARQLASFLLILPVIAVLERYGLQQRAKTWVANIKGATTARILSLLTQWNAQRRWGY